jgi:hypothetical protein
VEVFDLSDPQAPVFVTELDYAAAKPFFGKLMGRYMVVGDGSGFKDGSGFQVIGEVAP